MFIWTEVYYIANSVWYTDDWGYLLFILPVFQSILQREDPCIHLVHGCCESLLKKLLAKFVKLRAIKTAATLAEVNTDIANQLSDDNIFVVGLTLDKHC